MKMVMHIVGNRPQFIKLAPVSRALRQRGIQEIIVHTGQHYDANMSDVFFEELDIPKPAENLHVGSGSHAVMTAKAMIAIEKVVLDYQPECVLIYGDTDSTLAAAIVVSKLNIPLIHVEAGARTGNLKNPEEKNRLTADAVSDILCTPNKISTQNLIKENVSRERIFFTGDVMYDQFLYTSKCGKKVMLHSSIPEKYALLTWHRQENTCDEARMEKIVSLLQEIDYDVVFPIHPRTKKRLLETGLMDSLESNSKIHMIDPVGYNEMVYLMSECSFIVTDSGGVCKEASFADKPCFYMLDLDVWPELEKAGCFYRFDVDNAQTFHEAKEQIKRIIAGEVWEHESCHFFGDGHAAEEVVNAVIKLMQK